MEKEGRGKVVIVLLLLVFFAYLVFSWKSPRLESPAGLQTAEINSPPAYQEQNVSAKQGTEQAINLSQWFSDPEGANLTFAVDNPDATLEGAVARFIPTSAGNYVLTVIVSDGENTVYKPISFTVVENPDYVPTETLEESANTTTTPEPELAPAPSRDI